MEGLAVHIVNNHRQDGWLAVALLMTLVETVFFGLRVYCRQLSRVGWGADDYLVVAAYIAGLALNGLGIAITTTTWVGQHTEDVVAVDPENAVLLLKLIIPLALLYICAAILPKMAIVALFLRIFIQKPFRIACRVLQGFLVLYLLAGIGSILLTCQPFSANWALPGTLTHGEKCFDITSLYKAGSYPNLVSDIAIILLPIPIITKIQKSKSEKVGLLATFSLGGVGLAFSIARLVAFFTIFSESDIVYTAAYTGIFTTLEPASYFLVSCMIIFRRLLHLPCCGSGRKPRGSEFSYELHSSSSSGGFKFGRSSYKLPSYEVRCFNSRLEAIEAALDLRHGVKQLPPPPRSITVDRKISVHRTIIRDTKPVPKVADKSDVDGYGYIYGPGYDWKDEITHMPTVPKPVRPPRSRYSLN